MMEFPSTDWQEGEAPLKSAENGSPVECDWRELPGLVRHTFTHFHLELTVWAGQSQDLQGDSEAGVLCPPDKLGDFALPTVMKKVARHVMAHS